MEKNLQADTETLMQICTDTLVRNLRLWRVHELIRYKSILVEVGMEHKGL